MQLIYVNMQHIHVEMQHFYVNMQDDYVNLPCNYVDTNTQTNNGPTHAYIETIFFVSYNVCFYKKPLIKHKALNIVRLNLHTVSICTRYQT